MRYALLVIRRSSPNLVDHSIGCKKAFLTSESLGESASCPCKESCRREGEKRLETKENLKSSAQFP